MKINEVGGKSGEYCILGPNKYVKGEGEIICVKYTDTQER